MRNMIANDYPEAMFHICPAIDATAKRFSGKRGRKNYKDFLTDNMDIVCGFSVGTPLSGIRLNYVIPGITAPDGSCSLEEIIYHSVRCGLAHEAAIPTNILITENQLGDPNGSLLLPKSIICGLIMAVVGSPANSLETCQETLCIHLNGVGFQINQWWGRSGALRKQMLSAIASKSATEAT